MNLQRLISVLPPVAAFLIAANPCLAPASGLESLETFLRSTRTGRAEFTQTVTAPPRQGEAARSKQSSGSFEFARPSRFKFVYRKPFEQTLVADGQTLWFLDVDLNQVTARRQAQVLGSTPAALLATAPSVTALREAFELTELPERDGLQWVQATPRAREGQITQVQMGFEGNTPVVLDILDGFGQRSVLRFARMELNPALPESTFQFKPPAGADVLRP